MSKRPFRLAISKNKVAWGALAVGLLVAGLPALGQQQSPESILPPGFSEPAPAQTPTPSATPIPGSGPSAPVGGAGGGLDGILGNLSDGDLSDEAPDAATIDPAQLAQYEMPGFARRSLAVTGIVGPDQGGMQPDAFGRTDGRFLERLMGRLDAPIVSRWLSISLRRALASRLSTPAGLNGADFAAERAWLLVRMGEPVVARAVVQSVDTANFTPKLYEAALQTSLASADPGGLCPIAEQAKSVARDRAWVLSAAFCKGLSGDPQAATEAMKAARRSGAARGIDQLLADKLLGAGASGRQAVTIEWQGVDQLTAWRYGLATSTGVTIPETLLASANDRVQFWRAQAAWLDATTRVRPAELAAAQGVFSNSALVDLYSDVETAADQTSPEVGTAHDLRTAYVDADPAIRLSTMQQLWNEPQTKTGRYARLILTARAATRLSVEDGVAASDDLIASMLSAGLESAALRWRRSASRGSAGWAMVAIIDANGKQLTKGDIAAFQNNDNKANASKAPMFFAALAGLNRLNAGDEAGLAKTLDVNLAINNPWSRALDQAVAANAPGTVLLLCATGMQTRDWHGVSPAAMYRIIDALHRVGLDSEARMIAVEALTRL